MCKKTRHNKSPPKWDPKKHPIKEKYMKKHMTTKKPKTTRPPKKKKGKKGKEGKKVKRGQNDTDTEATIKRKRTAPPDPHLR